MCGLEKEILTQLLCSVLPTELAIEIMNRKDGNYRTSISFADLMSAVCNILGILFY